MPVTGVSAVHRRTRGEGETKEASMELRRMQPADVHAHGAAMIEIRAEHRALLASRHRIGFDAERAVQHLGFARETLVVPVAPRRR